MFWLLSFFVFKFQICTHFLFTRFCFLYRVLVVFCRLFLRLFLEEDVSKLLFAISMDLEWNSDETGEERFVPGKVLWSFITGNCRTHLFSQDGQNTAHFIHQFPKLNLTAHVQPIIHTAMRGEPTASPDFQWVDKFHGYTEPFWDNDVDSVLHHQYFMLNEQYIDRDHTLSFTVPIYEYRRL